LDVSDDSTRPEYKKRSHKPVIRTLQTANSPREPAASDCG
jgi:hypothetical protein